MPKQFSVKNLLYFSDKNSFGGLYPPYLKKSDGKIIEMSLELTWGGSNLAEVPLANGISTSRSIKFELGFGVCLYKTEIILGLPAKPLIERSRSSTEYSIFIFS